MERAASVTRFCTEEVPFSHDGTYLAEMSDNAWWSAGKVVKRWTHDNSSSSTLSCDECVRGTGAAASGSGGGGGGTSAVNSLK
jgi:hypothetical protein